MPFLVKFCLNHALPRLDVYKWRKVYTWSKDTHMKTNNTQRTQMVEITPVRAMAMGVATGASINPRSFYQQTGCYSTRSEETAFFGSLAHRELSRRSNSGRGEVHFASNLLMAFNFLWTQGPPDPQSPSKINSVIAEMEG